MAISTTGDKHRLGVLERCAQAWWMALVAHGLPSNVFVTVDGTQDEADRVAVAVLGFAQVFRVGQKVGGDYPRLGVATNKNTGLELLMDYADADHLFLSDDDTWPLFPQSLDKHVDLGLPHSMVMWGKHRLDSLRHGYATWTWPRGVMLYTHRAVVEDVGGMDERFGPGGHEHAEWSQRIRNAGFTREPFVSPASYATREAMGATALWYAEDMPRRGESRFAFARRKRAHTSVTTTRDDWINIDKVMASHEGDDGYVPFRAEENGRASATLCPAPSRGAVVIERDKK